MEIKPTKVDERPISIFVYNTHLFGGIFFAELGIEYHKDEERRKEIAKRINESDYDVVGLCEVWADSYKDYLRKRCNERYPFCCFKSKGVMDLMGSGLLILSRFPIEEWYFESYKTLNGIDAVTYKGVLGVVINFDESENEAREKRKNSNSEDGTLRSSSKPEKALNRTSDKKRSKGEKLEIGKKEIGGEKAKSRLLRLFLTHCQAQNDAESSRSRESNWRQLGLVAEKFRPDVASGTVLMGDMNTVYTVDADAEYVSMKNIFGGYATGLPERPSKANIEELNGGELKVEPTLEAMSIEPVLLASRIESPEYSFVPTIDPLNNTLARIFESSKIQIADFILYKDLTPVVSSEVVTDWKLEDGDDCSDHYPVRSTFYFNQ